MRETQSLSHSQWDCKYHLVFIPKYRRKVIYGSLRPYLGAIFHELASHKGCEILEGASQIRPCTSVYLDSPKYAVSSVVGYLKGKSAILIARNFAGKRRHFVGESFWARGYYISTVGLDETGVTSI